MNGPYVHLPAVPDLLGVARANAWKNFGISILAIVGGAALTAVGVVFFLFIPIGVILMIAGLIYAPISIWRAIDPTGHEAVRDLGATADERAHALKRVEWELGHPASWHVRMTSGTLSVTPTWLVHHSGSSLVLLARRDLVWFWETVERGRYGSTSHYLSMHSRRKREAIKIPMQAGPDHHVWAALAHACPFAFSGYGPALKQMPIEAIAAEVDRRAWAASQQHTPAPASPYGVAAA